MTSAYVQRADCKRAGYVTRMQPEQRIIAEWMKRQMRRLKWTPADWARESGMRPTNISRAIKEDYDSVTTVRTLHQLAKAAKVPSVLDFLEGQQGSAFNADAVSSVLAELLRRPPNGGWTEKDAPRLVATIEYGLGLAVNDPAKPTSPDRIEVAARAAVDRLHDTPPQA